MSTVISQSAGITLRFSEACAFVGATVIASSGSISSPASGETALAARERIVRGRDLAEQRLQEALHLGDQLRRRPRRRRAARSSGAALTSALSAIEGIDACPLRPCTRSRNGELIFSAVEQR